MSDPRIVSRRSALGAVVAGGAALTAAPVATAQSGNDRGNPVSPMQFGAKGDGVHDDSDALQTAADSGRPIVLPPGRYRITRPIELAVGQSVSGAVSVNAGAHVAWIVNDVPGSGCLWYSRDRDTARRGMPVIANLRLTADHPIRFNDPERGHVDDGARSDIPYGTRPAVRDCEIVARTRGTGIGIAWTKMFDGVIEGCEIIGFGINLLLLGCDLNAVRRNRITLATRFQILELSVGTFGSQNLIEHNDILAAGSPECIFIKTTARHARIRDNYLEHGEDDVTITLTGFIDASSVGTPRIGRNPGGERLTTILRDNRIDGASRVTGFVYRYQPGGQTYGEIVDPGTTGGWPRKGARYLALVDGNGAITDQVPVIFSQTNACAFDFCSPEFGIWNGFRSSSVPGRRIDGRTIGMFDAPMLFANHANRYLAVRGDTLLLLPGFAGQARLTLGPDNALLEAGQAYVLRIVARSPGGTEVLTIGRMENDAGTAAVPLRLSPRFQRFDCPLAFSPQSARARRGFYLERSGGAATIEIESIELLLQ